MPLQPAQDFKRVADGDLGPNTGGMGAYSPLPWAPDRPRARTSSHRVVQPTVDELRHRGTPFVGVVYAGLALTSRGLRVIEFNARFGDPETQVVLARLRTPLAHVLLAAATGGLHDLEDLRWSDGAAVTVVVAAENYPGTPVTGGVIGGLDEAAEVERRYVLHAGTAYRRRSRRSSRPAAACSRWSASAPTSPRRASGPTPPSSASSSPAAHHRSDIALAAELGEVRLP